MPLRAPIGLGVQSGMGQGQDLGQVVAAAATRGKVACTT